MQLTKHDIHLWSIDLNLNKDQMQEKKRLLSDDELQRANRFRFPIHQQQFVAARSALRQILSIYTNIDPNLIIFDYADNKKPSLAKHFDCEIQFNLAHSDHLALIGVTTQAAIGVDIEKMKSTYHPGVAERFFSLDEKKVFFQLPEKERLICFYRIWVKKEAIIKALGKGLAYSLQSFTVSPTVEDESIVLENETWSLRSLPIHPEFQSAIATNQPIHALTYWSLNDDGGAIELTL